MGWPSFLNDLETPCNWDHYIFCNIESDQIEDRLPVCPKNWKRVLFNLMLAVDGYQEDDCQKAKKYLYDAYVGILEPFAEMMCCGTTICYREAMRHVLDSTWAWVVADDLDIDDEKADDPNYKAVKDFVATIKPVSKMDHRQRAAICAIKGCFYVKKESEKWFQKAIHLSPDEAQWVIDLCYFRWDPFSMDVPYSYRGGDNILNLTLRIMKFTSKCSPSHFVKIPLFEKLMKDMSAILTKANFKSNYVNVHSDFEILPLAANVTYWLRDGKKKGNLCVSRKSHKKNCNCAYGWLDDLTNWANLFSICFEAFLQNDFAVVGLTYTGISYLVSGNSTCGIERLEAALKLQPKCMYLHMRIAEALMNAQPNQLAERKVAARALKHAKKCEDVYWDVLELVEEAIEEAIEEANRVKPNKSLKKAGRRW